MGKMSCGVGTLKNSVCVGSQAVVTKICGEWGNHEGGKLGLSVLGGISRHAAVGNGIGGCVVWTDALGVGGANDVAEAGGWGAVESVSNMAMVAALLFSSDEPA